MLLNYYYVIVIINLDRNILLVYEGLNVPIEIHLPLPGIQAQYFTLEVPYWLTSKLKSIYVIRKPFNGRTI